MISQDVVVLVFVVWGMLLLLCTAFANVSHGAARRRVNRLARRGGSGWLMITDRNPIDPKPKGPVIPRSS